jgi:hypothetical protein
MGYNNKGLNTHSVYQYYLSTILTNPESCENLFRIN